MNVVLNGFGDPAAIERQRAAIEREHGVAARHVGADMAKPAEIEAMMTRAITFGAIDVLVNNAGIQHVAAVDAFPVDRWDAIIAINLCSAFHRRGRAARDEGAQVGTHRQHRVGARADRVAVQIGGRRR